MIGRFAFGGVGLALSLAGLAGPVLGAERLAGPVSAEVVSVLDGDTLEVRAQVWLGQVVTTRVRLAGIDAPELSGKCAGERALAIRAQDFLRRHVPGVGGRVVLRDIRYGKYAGRVLARVETPEGTDLGAGLIRAGLARPYAGKRRAPWCDDGGAIHLGAQ